MSAFIQSHKIVFYFCVPYKFWKKVQVASRAKVSCLKKVFDPGKEECYYVYEGNIIDQNSTFENIGIIDEKVIFAISGKMHQKEKFDLMKLYNDPLFEKRLKILSNKSSKQEFNRISDIKYMKIEGNLKLYKKQEHKYYLKNLNESETTNNIQLCINYQPPSVPCTAAMPILW